MNSILIAASEAFTESLREFTLNPDLVNLISGGIVNTCLKTECYDICIIDEKIQPDCTSCE